MTAHEIHALSGAYAVDALDDLERARFEEHLAACASCQAEVNSLSDATLLLTDLTEVAPPAALRESVLSSISNVRPLPPVVARIERRRPRRLTSLVAAAAVLGVLGGSAYVAQDVLSSDKPTSQVPSANAEIDRVLTAADVQHVSAMMPRGSATVFRSVSAQQAVLVTRAMPAAPKDRIYQLWFKQGGTFHSAGLMTRGGDQRILLDGNPNDATAVGVTVEQPGGSPTGEPTTAPVAMMEFEQAT